jgi:hypothetical protein
MVQQPTIGFVPEPNCGRGTIGIIWSCLATIILCTYSALHLDAKIRNDKWFKIRRQISQSLIAIMAPEYLANKAIRDFMRARKIFKKARQNGWNLTLCQAHLINMNGIQIRRFGSVKESVVVGFDKICSILDNASLRTYIQEQFPSDESISDTSKSDVLGKGITILQMIWFVSQVLTRHIEGLSVSIIELSTLAYVCLAVATYAAWFNKPQGISTPIVIIVDSDFELEKIEKKFWDDFGLGSMLWEVAVWFGCVAAFAAIHILAWNYAFPSTIEKWLWRMCSLFCIVFGWMMPSDMGTYWVVNSFKQKKLPSTAFRVNYSLVCGFFYMLARLYLISEAFLIFRKAPESVYETVHWPLYIPSFG